MALKLTKRYIYKQVVEDLAHKMVFIGGPRQVGKTFFALGLLPAHKKQHPAYLNWDILSDRKNILRAELPANQKRIVLDEIHKYSRWRGLVKGFYDRYAPEVQFLVTGSARLDHYRKGGDSLQGRYHYFRLHPLTLAELSSTPSKSDVQALMTLGGFPEPFLRGESAFHRRWQRERIARVLQEDVRDLERVQEISLLDLLVDALPERITSPISLNSIANELQVSQASIDRWITILENLYMCFRIAPYGEARIRAVRKERKLYFWDWSQATSEGARFENFVASHLLKYCHWKEDTAGYRMELRYLRDSDSREVDFVVLQDRKPLFAVEAKLSAREASPALEYFQARTKIPFFYQVHLGTQDVVGPEKNIRVLPFATFAAEIGLV